MDILIKCQEHPMRYVTNVYIRKDCPLSSRLLCNKCIADNLQVYNDCIDFGDFLEDPLNMLNLQNRTLGIFDELKLYFQRGSKDPMAIIEDYRNKMNDQLNQLQADLNDSIKNFNKFKDMINIAKDQFIEAVKHKQLLQNIQQLIGIDNYYQTEQWKQTQYNLNDYIQQFIDQDNQELKQILYSLQMNDMPYFQQNQFLNFTKKCESLLDKLKVEFQSISLQFLDFSNLCPNFNIKLLQKIDSNLQLKTTLLFRGTEHGMNSNAFWNKCENQGPTLVICKSANGIVFGGYSPCKWIKNQSSQSDFTLKSFLFNSNKEEFYPLTEEKNSIYGHPHYGPTFGGGHDLYIASNFKGGYSKIGTSYCINNTNKIINYNQQTHLMGSLQPELIEIEVFLIHKIK